MTLRRWLRSLWKQPIKPVGLELFNEFGPANIEVQSAFMRLILDRRITIREEVVMRDPRRCKEPLRIWERCGWIWNPTLNRFDMLVFVNGKVTTQTSSIQPK